METNLAILIVLAKRPKGRASVDEVTSDLERLAASGEPSDVLQFLSDHVALLVRSQLVGLEHGELWITDAGRALLRSLIRSSKACPQLAAMLGLQTVKPTAVLRREDQMLDRPLDGTAAPSQKRPIAERKMASESSPYVPDPKLEAGAIQIPQVQVAPSDALPFLDAGVNSRLKKHRNNALQRLRSSAWIRSCAEIFIGWTQPLKALWNAHLERDRSQVRRRAGNTTGMILAFVVLFVMTIGAVAMVAVGQVNVLKSEIAGLRRELTNLKEDVARQVEERRTAERQKENQIRTDSDKSNVAEPAAAALSLTPEEMQLIRDYIKPAPFAGASAPPINVGDPVTSGTIPLPSPVTDKIPKLLGARFTIRDGVIIIIRRDSQRADAVLPPH